MAIYSGVYHVHRALIMLDTANIVQTQEYYLGRAHVFKAVSYVGILASPIPVVLDFLLIEKHL